MSYSDFKTLEDVKKKFGVSINSSGSLFANIEQTKASEQLTAVLNENISLALNINTEKARSEMIIAPVLIEVRKLLERKVSLFSGLEFNVDEKLGLTGYCDFILSKSPDQVFIEFPVVCIVEAKNENIKSGYAQCMAEMIAAEMYNKKKSFSAQSILGVVTTGSNWRFLKLEQNTIYIDYEEYLISQIDIILSVFVKVINSISDKNLTNNSS